MKSAIVEAPNVGASEKITINLGVVDLGQVDLLVREGFYSNRTDMIRTAIRNQLSKHAAAVRVAVDHQALRLGLQQISRAELEQARADEEPLNIRVVGLVRIASDVSPQLARASIASVKVLGVFQASPAVRRALADRIS